MYKFGLPLICAFVANVLCVNAQNVGIGVEHPGSKLSVKGGISIGDTYAEKSAPNGSMLIEKSMGIGTDVIDTNVVLDIRSATKGVLFPTMNTATRNSILNPPKGLFVFNEDSSGFNFYNGTSWLNFALLGPTGPVGQIASVLGIGSTENASGYVGSSVSAVTVGTGTKIFLTQLNLAYRAGDRVRISGSGKTMEGVVQTYLAGTLTVSVDRISGSGLGLTWSIGLAGEVGATGAQGATGTAGARGATGATGATGAQGIQGTAGATGAQGIQGIAGATGAQGPQGIAGPAGAAGARGATGATGSTGAQGVQGIQGITGATGAQGIQGIAGVTGAQGPQGVQGNMVRTGAGIPAGTLGNVGDFYLNSTDANYYLKSGSTTWIYVGNLKGEQGDQGPAGPQGNQGVAGPQGVQGPQGVTGNTGAQGIQGVAGPAGAVGAAGARGATGATGNTGAQGAQGVQGIAGATGTQGAQGIQGVAGPTGPQGAQGVQGVAGAAGANGATWLNGSGVPSSSAGIINDFYLNSSNGTYYKKTAATTWTSQGSLKGATGSTGANGAVGAQGPAGPAGAQGPVGPAGAAGSNGTLWYTGNSTPGSGVGAINDFYLNSSNGTYYKKTNSTTWASQGSLKGATGSTGAQGPAGTLSNGSAAGNTPYWNGSSWVVNSSNIYNNGSNVGIGTTAPSHKFEVMNGDISIDNTNNTAGQLVLTEPSGSGTNYTAFRARAQSANITYSLPASQAANTMLLNDGSGNLTWAPVNQQVISMFERKISNQSSTSSAFADDNDFTYTLEANQTYEISGLIRISAHKDGEWKMQFAGPTGCQTLISMAYNTEYLDEMIWITAPNTTYYMLGEGADPNSDVVFVNGIVTTGSTAGTFKFKWAQKNTYSTATTIYANSYIRLTRVE